MKTSTKVLIGTGLIMALTMGGFFAALARAEGEGGGLGRGPFAWRLAMLRGAFYRAGVTKEQGEQIKQIVLKHYPETKPLMDKMLVEHRALRDLIRAENVDEKAIRDQVARLAAVGADIAVKRAYTVHEVRGVLNTEQIGKLNEMQANLDTHVDDVREQIAKRLQGE
jgi:Spy/CpxP family protein refolding chaperone